MGRFKIGDKVRIRPDLPDQNQWDGLFCNPHMKEMRGKIAYITRITTVGRYRLNLDGGKWNWNDAMLEPTRRKFNSLLERK